MRYSVLGEDVHNYLYSFYAHRDLPESVETYRQSMTIDKHADSSLRSRGPPLEVGTKSVPGDRQTAMTRQKSGMRP